MEVVNIKNCKEMLIYVADKIIESKPYLTEVDSAIGDGDHGIGMAGGLKKAKEKLHTMNDVTNIYDLFSAAGNAMLMSMGGASGVIFGSMFMAGAKNQQPKQELTPDDLAEMMKKSVRVIKERGKANIGDKTMIDALEPAAVSMGKYAAEGLLPMLMKAEEAAKEGMEKTKNFQAKFGRAKSLLERAIGFQDAGATSVWIIFRSMREYVQRH